MDQYFIDKSSSGKTRKMLEEAKKNNLVVVCKNPSAMRIKADNYCIFGLKIVGYDDINSFDNNEIAIDELNEFFEYYFGVKIGSFTMTT